LKALLASKQATYYALQCATTTAQIKLATLSHSSLYACYATSCSCTSSARREVKQPSHYPVPVPIPAGYAGGYPATSGFGRISKI